MSTPDLRLYFVRHGESEANIRREFANWTDVHPLTERGRMQTLALAAKLRPRGIDQIYSSPVRRARESASLLAGALGVRFVVSEALREYDVGSLEGTSSDAAWQSYDEVLSAWLLEQRWEERTGGGECFHDIAKRFVPFLEQLRTEHPNAAVVLVGHSGLFRCMLPHVLHNVSYRFAHAHLLDHASWVLGVDEHGRRRCAEWNGRRVEDGEVLDA